VGEEGRDGKMTNEDEFTEFFLKIWKNHLDPDPPDIRFLKERPSKAAYFAFLLVVTEDNDAAVLKELLKDQDTRYLAEWEETARNNVAFLKLWKKIGKLRTEAFSHRAYMAANDFAKCLRQYFQTVKRFGSPSALIDERDWRKTWDNFDGVWWFGDLARFDYLRRICALRLSEYPDEIPHTGKGPLKGLRMIYGKNATLKHEGKHLLNLIRDRTNDPNVVFELEDMLCLMHYHPIDSEFHRYFKSNELQTLLAKYLKAYGDGRRCYARPKIRCYARPRRKW
jgi:hypothetical protein